MTLLPRVTLQRFCRSDAGVFGRIHVAGVVLYTVERPWLGNQPRVSCIPPGEYPCEPRMFFRGGYPAVEIKSVPGRSHILFHKANWADDLEGCIGVGTSWGCVGGRIGVARSAPAFEHFMEQLGHSPFTLSIVNV